MNLLKVSAKDDGVFRALLNAFEGVTYTTEDGYTLEGSALMDTVALYISREMQKNGRVDVRVCPGQNCMGRERGG